MSHSNRASACVSDPPGPAVPDDSSKPAHQAKAGACALRFSESRTTPASLAFNPQNLSLTYRQF
jgi:hypothetical protein